MQIAVISLSASSATAKSFFVGRFIRLVPCAWICATITLFVGLYATDTNPNDFFVRFLNSIFFYPKLNQIDVTYWTLGIEISFYMVIWFLLAFNLFNKFWSFITILLVVSTVYNISLFLIDNPQRFFNRAFDLLLLRHGCEFAVGALVFKITNKEFKFIEGYIYLLLIFIGLIGSCFEVLYSGLGFKHNGIIEFNIDTIQKAKLLITIWFLSFVSFITLIFLNNQLHQVMDEKRINFIRNLGIMTYPLYLIHHLVGRVILNKLSIDGLGNYTSLFVTIVIILFLTFFISKVETLIKHPINNSVLFLLSIWSNKHLGKK